MADFIIVFLIIAYCVYVIVSRRRKAKKAMACGECPGGCAGCQKGCFNREKDREKKTETEKFGRIRR